jgi:undecaprenyl-diphosphatase
MRFRISRRTLALRHAAVLGLLHGPAELLPVSSSAHTSLLPWLLGWNYEQIDPELRKGFEVALHGGTAAALLIGSGHGIARRLDRRQLTVTALAAAPPGVAGYLLRPLIERRLGTATTIAAGLIAGSAVMLYADRAPQERSAAEAGVDDGLWLGMAQAFALIPGVSRSGLTLSAARLRRFARPDAARLAYGVGLPVIVAAAARELTSMHDGQGEAVAVGATAAFGSTLLAMRLIRPDAARRLTGFALYRLGLAGLVLIRRAS